MNNFRLFSRLFVSSEVAFRIQQLLFLNHSIHMAHGASCLIHFQDLISSPPFTLLTSEKGFRNFSKKKTPLLLFWQISLKNIHNFSIFFLPQLHLVCHYYTTKKEEKMRQEAARGIKRNFHEKTRMKWNFSLSNKVAYLCILCAHLTQEKYLTLSRKKLVALSS